MGSHRKVTTHERALAVLMRREMNYSYRKIASKTQLRKLTSYLTSLKMKNKEGNENIQKYNRNLKVNGLECLLLAINANFIIPLKS